MNFYMMAHLPSGSCGDTDGGVSPTLAVDHNLSTFDCIDADFTSNNSGIANSSSIGLWVWVTNAE